MRDRKTGEGEGGGKSRCTRKDGSGVLRGESITVGKLRDSTETPLRREPADLDSVCWT